MRLACRAVIRLTHISLLAIGCAFLLWILRLCGARQWRSRLQLAGYRAIIKAFHVTVRMEGTLAQAPVLFMANHCSYLDVFVLGSCGAMRFTPKSDVKGWPVIGQVVRSFDVIFVDRTRSKAQHAQRALLSALQQGSRICVFPEGTTNDGRGLKPFKPAMFSLAEQWQGEDALRIQPLMVRYDALNGAPMDDAAWERIAWYGDAELLSHAWRLCRVASIEVSVMCLAPIETEDTPRKRLAAHTQAVIGERLAHSKCFS